MAVTKPSTMQTLRLHKTAISWLLFGCMLALWLYFANQKTTSFVIDPEGLTTNEQAQLLRVVADTGLPSFYRTDLSAVADKIAQVSWVESVQVARQWRKGIVISVTPRTAVANFGSAHLLDVTGVVFRPADDGQLPYDRLISVYGNQAQSQAIMTQVYALNHWFAPLGVSVEDVILTPRQTWLIRFDNGLRLTVDHERAEQKLYTLSQLLQNGRLPVAPDEIASIDLRYKNGFSLTKNPTPNRS